MTISQQLIIQSTSGFVLGWGCRGRPIQQCHLYLRQTEPHCHSRNLGQNGL